MDEARNATAAFEQIKHTLTVTKTGSGLIISQPDGINCGNDCDEDFVQGTGVALTAFAQGGWKFAGWGGACSGTAGCVVSMDEARSVSATFVELEPKPDGLIKLSNSSYVGNGIYNTTGNKQTKKATSKRGSGKTFLIKHPE